MARPIAWPSFQQRIAVAFVATLAVPVHEWRTGDQGLMPLRYAPGKALPARARRVWIDTDAACGTSRKTDPDDCLAIALLVQSQRFDIAGVSTTFGNAALPVADATVDALMAHVPAQARRPFAWFSGAGGPIDPSSPQPTRGSLALARALEAQPLVIIALGPLTNIAEALRARPDLRSRLVRLIAVMGRRPGHLFHPAAGIAARSFLGHGPIMRDFNYAQDPEAVALLLEMKLPLALVPYDAAVNVELTAADLYRLATTGTAMRWAAEHARAWLDYWQRDIGRRGLFPFDLVGAAYILMPAAFGCADVGVQVERDAALFAPLTRPRGLLVSSAAAATAAQYCGRADMRLLDAITASAGQ